MKNITRALLILSALLPCSSVFGMDRVSGYCQQGNQTITVQGMTSSSATPVMRSYPSCTVTVYITGTTTTATIYSDNSGTSKSNPFTASSTGYWFFYAADATYDVKISATGLTTFTLPAISSFDPINPFSAAISDVSYTSFSALCTAGASKGGIILTKAWTGLSTQSCASDIYLFGGTLTPASSATVTLTGRIVGSQKAFPYVSSGAISFTGNSYTTYVNASWFGFGDGSATNTHQLQYAINSMPSTGGTLVLPMGQFSLGSAGIIVPENVILKGAGMSGSSNAYCSTALTYTGTGAAIAKYSTATINQFTSGGVEDMCIIGNSTSSGQIGLWFGGDPSSTLSPSTSEGARQNINRVLVSGFTKNVSWGNNAYILNFNQVMLVNSAYNVYVPSGITNSGERMSFSQSIIGQANTYNIYVLGAFQEFDIIQSSLDYDTGSGGIYGAFLSLTLNQCHMEKYSGPFFTNVSGLVSIVDTVMLLTLPTGTDSTLGTFSPSYGDVMDLQIIGGNIFSSHPVTTVFTFSGYPAFSSIDYRNIYGNGNHAFVNADNIATLRTPVTTTATASSGSTSLTVASSTGIQVGQYVQGTNIGVNAVVTAVSGTTVTVSAATTGVLSGSSVSFVNTSWNNRTCEQSVAPFCSSGNNSAPSTYFGAQYLTQALPGVAVNETTSPYSRQARMDLGLGCYFLQDPLQNNTRDFGIICGNQLTPHMMYHVSADATKTDIGPGNIIGDSTLNVWNVAATGPTKFVVRQSSVQSSNNMIEFQRQDGVVLQSVGWNGVLSIPEFDYTSLTTWLTADSGAREGQQFICTNCVVGNPCTLGTAATTLGVVRIVSSTPTAVCLTRQ